MLKSFPLPALSDRQKSRAKRCTNIQQLTNAHAFALLRHLRSSRRIRPCFFCSSSSAVSRSRYIKHRRIAADEENLTLFEKELKRLGIAHQKIRPYTPRHNGKAERSHRKDNEEFYATHTFFSFEDFKVQLARRNRAYNNFPMRPLGWKSPREALSLFLSCVRHD